MDAFTTHTGIGAPLKRSNVDTDQFDGNGHLTGEIYIKTLTDLMEALRAEIARG